MKYRIALSAVFLALVASMAFAQFSGNVSGVVQDASGAVVPSAKVELKNVGTGVTQETTTSEAGVYRFSSLPPGEYEVRAEAAGFRPKASKLTLTTGQTAGVNFSLEVGQSSEQVTVTGEAPALDTAESRTQATIQQQTLRDLPFQGRNFLGLVAIAPGVTGRGAIGGGAPADAPDNFSTEKTVDASGNGRNSSGNQFTVDGLNITSNIIQGVSNLSPNPDSIQEISIQTNTFSAEQGRASSIQVAVTTKSGTNQYHGTGSYFFFNQDLYARTVFTQKYEPFKRHDISGTFGGPVIKNKTFFFASVQPMRSQISSAEAVRTFESADFVNWAKGRYPSTIGTKLLSDNNVQNIAITGVSRTARDIFGADCGGPNADNIPCDLPMVVEGRFKPSPARNGLQYSFRGDQYIGQKDRIYANYYSTNLDAEQINLRRGFGTFFNNNNSSAIQANWTRSFTPTLINEFSFGRIRVEGNSAIQDDLPVNIPDISINFQNQGISPGWGPATFIQNNYNWRDVLSWVKGAHTLKFGFQAWWGDDDARFNGVNGRPSFAFNNLLDLVKDQPFRQNGPAYDPLTGKPGIGGYRHLLNTFGGFVQDDWKVKPNLTLTLGLRWDDYGNPHADLNLTPTFGNIILGQGSTLLDQIATASVRSVPGAYNNRMRAWSPRFGFAWDPSKDGKWAIRGGFGLFNDWVPLGQANTIRGNPPGVIYPAFVRGQTAVEPIFSIGTQNTFPFGFVLPTLPAQQLDERGGVVGAQVSAGGIDRNVDSPYSAIWNIGVERQLPGRWVVGATYSGSYTWGSLIGTDMNRFAGDLLDGTLNRRNPSFGSMTYVFNGNNIKYNAGIFSVRRNVGSRSQIQASYTVSRVIDYGQGGSRVNRDGNFNYPEPSGFERWQSLADWDATHRVSLAGFYQLPEPGGSNPFLKRLFGGWQLNSVMILQSGQPINIVNRGPWDPIRDANGNVTGFKPGSGDYNADGFQYDYPNAPAQSFGSWGRQDYIRGLFTAADFPAPAAGTQGDLERSFYRGPGLVNIDAGMIKNNPMPFLGEQGNLQLRFEFFNVLNRVNLNNPDGNLNSPTFGRSLSTLNPRIIQLGARLVF